MHQWFGDNVAEAAFNMTFWKEGFATIGEYLATARTAATAAGGLGTPAGDAAFETSLISRFNTNYDTTSSTAWTSAPSNPTVGNLFTTSNTYTRPGTAYLALWRILGRHDDRDDEADPGRLRRRLHHRGAARGGVPPRLPNQSAACNARLDQFFTQWFDTATRRAAARTSRRSRAPAWPARASSARRRVTSPREPDRDQRLVHGPRHDHLEGTTGCDPTTTMTGCVNRTSRPTDQHASCDVTTTAAPTSARALSRRRSSRLGGSDDNGLGLAAAPDLLNGWYGNPVTVTLSPRDGTWGIAASTYTVDGGPPQTYSAPFAIATEGSHTIQYWSTDNAGNRRADEHR